MDEGFPEPQSLMISGMAEKFLESCLYEKIETKLCLFKSGTHTQ